MVESGSQTLMQNPLKLRADLEHELRLPGHSVRLGPPAGEHERRSTQIWAPIVEFAATPLAGRADHRVCWSSRSSAPMSDRTWAGWGGGDRISSWAPSWRARRCSSCRTRQRSGWPRDCSGCWTRRSTSAWSRSARSWRDKLPDEQRTVGFVMQSFFIGIGAAVANALPEILGHFGVTGNAPNGCLSSSVRLQTGRGGFLPGGAVDGAHIKEYPPENMEEFRRRQKREHRNFSVEAGIPGGWLAAGAAAGRGAWRAGGPHLTLWHVLAGEALAGRSAWS